MLWECWGRCRCEIVGYSKGCAAYILTLRTSIVLLDVFNEGEAENNKCIGIGYNYPDE